MSSREAEKKLKKGCAIFYVFAFDYRKQTDVTERNISFPMFYYLGYCVRYL